MCGIIIKIISNIQIDFSFEMNLYEQIKKKKKKRETKKNQI